MKIVKDDESADVKQTLRDVLDIDAAVWSLGRLFSKPATGSIPLWGLFVFDADGNLHFVCFDQENWYSQLLNSGKEKSAASGNGIRYHAEYPGQDRVRLENISKRGFFSRLLKPFPLFHLYMKDADGPVIFELEDPSSEFLVRLENGS